EELRVGDRTLLQFERRDPDVARILVLQRRAETAARQVHPCRAAGGEGGRGGDGEQAGQGDGGAPAHGGSVALGGGGGPGLADLGGLRLGHVSARVAPAVEHVGGDVGDLVVGELEIGRASCRERGGASV